MFAESDAMSTVSGMSTSDYEAEYAKYIHSFKVQEKDRTRNFVYCKVCLKFPKIVQLHTANNKIAPITTSNGTRYRKESVEKHFMSLYHAKCKEAEKVADCDSAIAVKGTMDVHISESNKKLANHIGKLFIQVYANAQKLTSSAFSWPARYVAGEASNQFDFNSNNPTISLQINLQYVNPVSHLELLKTIVQSDRTEFKQKIETARAYSIHIDGSVDRKHIDKIYILLKIINSEGELETVFLGIGQKKQRGAIGLFEATVNGIIDNVGNEIYALIMSRVSSICTDGENQNTGDKHSLWVLFEKECQKYRSDLPLTKLWCSAHRLELVWGDLTAKVPEVKNALSIISSISTHFRESSMRTEELKSIAAQNQLKFVLIPKIFKIRWTEWTYKAIDSVLKSLRAILKYCEFAGNATATGFETFLTNLQSLKLIFFLADLLQIYQRHHKNVQRDDLTIVSLAKYIGSLKSSLEELQREELIGGWEYHLKKDMIVESDKVVLDGIELVTANYTRSAGSRNFQEIRSEIIKTAIDMIENRFMPDEQLMQIIQPFIEFNENCNIEQIHATFGTDLQLSTLNLEFKELTHLKLCNELTLKNQIKKLILPENASKYGCVLAILCRINACTPQSADTERSIKANNLFKTAFRNRLELETENKYMYVYFNMPPLEEWNPRNAILTWINAKNRREHIDLIKKETARNRPYFKGIFKGALESDDDEDDCTSSQNIATNETV